MIRVLIERRIAQGLEHYYDCTVKRTISQVVRAPGCLAGESLKDSLDPRRRIIMSKWASLEDWENWLYSAERKNVISELAPLLDGSERITMLEHTHQNFFTELRYPGLVFYHSLARILKYPQDVR